MLETVLEQLRHLGGTLGELRVRVRAAVAGEVGRAVAEAVREVVGTALDGRRAGAPRTAGYDRYDAYGRDTWDDDESDRRWARSGYRDPAESDEPDDRPRAGDPPAAAVLAAAVAAGRWWLGRAGSPLGATALGIATAGAVLTGGPVARAAVGVLWAAHKLLAATDALGDGAKALDRL